MVVNDSKQEIETIVVSIATVKELFTTMKLKLVEIVTLQKRDPKQLCKFIHDIERIYPVEGHNKDTASISLGTINSTFTNISNKIYQEYGETIGTEAAAFLKKLEASFTSK